ncbi:MAG: MATE family efflux transporter [Planctomycetes bacterium]|nr:MATE family efflux transporter [Planctomycetota bacterium]
MSRASEFLPRAELRAMFGLALPVVVAQLGLVAFGTVDTMMVGHYSRSALAAAGAGHIFSMLILLVGFGLLQGLDPLIAQAVGAARPDKVAAHFHRGIVIAAGFAVLATLVMYQAGPLLRLFRQDEAMIPAAAGYVRIVAFGNLPFLLTVLLRQSLQAQGRVTEMLAATLIANLVNVLGNWLLVYGRFGCPELGLEGSAWSTAFSRAVLLLLLALFSRRHWWPWLQAGRGATRRGYASAFRLGLPLALQISFEAGVFNVVGLIMGHLGELELSANQVALNLASLAFMVPLGVSAAAASRVGNAIGAGRADDARASARVAYLLGFLFMSCSGLCFILLPGSLAALYSSDADTVALAARLLPIAGCFALFDGAQVIAHGVLRGTADTRVPALVSLAGYWIVGLPVGLWLCFHGEVWSPGLWWGLTAGLAFVALVLGLRLRRRLRGELAAFEHD